MYLFTYKYGALFIPGSPEDGVCDKAYMLSFAGKCSLRAAGLRQSSRECRHKRYI